MLSDLKAHLEHGAELLASHVPGLVGLAEEVEADPLVKAAIDLAVPAKTREMLAALLKSVEADVQRVAQDAEQAAHEKAQAEAAAPPAESAA